MLFDTHAHLDDPQLLPQLEQVLENAVEAGLAGITAIGTNLMSSQSCLDLARKHSLVHAAVGIHPNECQHADEAQWEQVLEIADCPEVVAIGETGLDRYWDDCPFERQQVWFARHIDLSFAVQKPLVIHMRECEQDMVEMLAQHRRDDRIIGIMHSFTGSRETAAKCLSWGMYISFAGMVTFKKSAELREVAATIPKDRILIETDSPYLSPHPHRGTRPNQPAMVQHTAHCLAEVFKMQPDEFAKQTTANARAVFGLAER